MLSRLFLRPSNLRLVTLVSSKSNSQIFSSFIRPLSTNSSGGGNGNGNGGNRSDVPWSFSGVIDDESNPFSSDDSWASSGVAGSGSAGGEGKWPEEPKRWNMNEEENKVVFDTGGEVPEGIDTGREIRGNVGEESKRWDMKEGDEKSVFGTGGEVASGFGTSGEVKSNEWDGSKSWSLKDEDEKVVFDTGGEIPLSFEPSLEDTEEERAKKEAMEKEEKELTEIIKGLVCRSMGRFSILKLLSKSPAAARNFQLRKLHSPASSLSRMIGKVKQPRESYLIKYRSRRSVTVTDFLDVLWCEKQMELRLHYGSRGVTNAMKRDIAIHAMIDKAHKAARGYCTGADSHSQEAYWANELFGYIKDIVKLMDMTDVEPIMLDDKLEKAPRSFSELKLLACVEGIWITGKMDIIEMIHTHFGYEPHLKDHKSTKGGKPSYGAVRERQEYQLMMYKLIWDSLVKGEFELKAFMDHFGLHREYVLPQGLRDEIAAYGLIHVVSFEQLVSKYVDLFKSLPLMSERIYLRYVDRDLPEHTHIEEEVSFNHFMVMTKLRRGISFWRREIKPEYTHQRFKCRSCDYPECPQHPKNKKKLAP